MTVLWILALCGVLLLAHEALRRSAPLAVVTFFVLPAVAPFLWKGFDLFYWIKLYLMTFAGFWLVLCRYTKLGAQRWALMVAYAIIVLNFGEVIVKGLLAGTAANIMDAAAGMGLLISAPSPLALRVAYGSPWRDIEWPITTPWLLGYTVWNWTFVYLNYPVNAGRTTAVLAASLLVGLSRRELWLQARTFTLGTYLLALLSFEPLGRIDTSRWANASVGLITSLIGGFLVMWSMKVRYAAYKRRASGPSKAERNEGPSSASEG